MPSVYGLPKKLVRKTERVTGKEASRRYSGASIDRYRCRVFESETSGDTFGRSMARRFFEVNRVLARFRSSVRPRRRADPAQWMPGRRSDSERDIAVLFYWVAIPFVFGLAVLDYDLIQL